MVIRKALLTLVALCFVAPAHAGTFDSFQQGVAAAKSQQESEAYVEESRANRDRLTEKSRLHAAQTDYVRTQDGQSSALLDACKSILDLELATATTNESKLSAYKSYVACLKE